MNVRIRQKTTCLAILLPAVSQDAAAGQVQAKVSTILEPFEVIGPTGHRIYGQLLRPDPILHPERILPAVVLIPGASIPAEWLYTVKKPNYWHQRGSSLSVSMPKVAWIRWALMICDPKGKKTSMDFVIKTDWQASFAMC
jgi:hypothetical protein